MIKALAIASDGCRYPAGERHALLVFAAAPSRDAAFDEMRRGATAHGWREIVVVRSRQVSSDTDAIGDAVLRAAARNAVERGCGIVAYDDPISSN